MIELPPIRKLMLPDKGHVMIDVDMSGADAQVVAWEANDKELMHAFQTGVKIHVKNYEDFWGKKFIPEIHKVKIEAGRLYTPYDEMKRAVHATNYYASARTVAATLQWKVSEAENFQRRWLKELHPGIEQWHRRVLQDVQLRRTVTNKFGYRIVYFSRPSEVLPEALAWIPQSTVAINAARAAINLTRGLPWVTILAQVHDSLLLQIPFRRWNSLSLRAIRDHITICTPYKPEPLYIPWSIKASTKSWGDVKSVKWSGAGLI